MKKLSKRDVKSFEGDDKYQGQKNTVSVGFGPENSLAYEPSKQADGNPALTMYWDFVKDQIFNKGNRWSAVVKQLKKEYTEITDTDVQELADKVDYQIQQMKIQRESSVDMHDNIKQMALRLAPVSPTRMSLYKVLRTSFPKYDNDIRQVMRELIEEKKADMGWFDSPIDLNHGHNDGSFPSVTWMPRGTEDQDVSPNIVTSDKRPFNLPSGPCAFCGGKSPRNKLWCSVECQDAWNKKMQEKNLKKSSEELLTMDQQKQVAATYGPEMNTALNHYHDALKRGHSKDRSMLYAIEEMKKVNIHTDPQKLVEAINNYLQGK